MNLELNQEQLLANPRPQQLARLAARSILFAQRHDRLKVSANQPEKFQKQYVMSPTLMIERPDLTDMAPFGSLHHYSTTALIRYMDKGSWRMKYVNGLQVEELGSNRPGLRDVYSFAWNEDEVTEASRQITITPKPPVPELIDTDMSWSSVSDDTVDMWQVADDFQSVTAGDVDMLISDLGARISQVDQEGKDYREERANYLDYFSK